MEIWRVQRRTMAAMETKFFKHHDNDDDMEDLQFQQWRQKMDIITKIMWDIHIHVPTVGMNRSYVIETLKRNHQEIFKFRETCKNDGINL